MSQDRPRSLIQIQQALKTQERDEESLKRQLASDRSQFCQCFDNVTDLRKCIFATQAFLHNPRLPFPSGFLDLFLAKQPRIINSPERGALNALEFLRHSETVLPSIIITFYDAFPDAIDHLTFSFIPSLFLLLLTVEEQTKFVHFLNEIYSQRPQLSLLLSRVAFHIPEFQDFLSKIECKMIIRYSEINSTDSFMSFFDTFLIHADHFKELIPPVISELARLPHGPEIFKQSFFDPFFENPARFRFAFVGESFSPEISILAPPDSLYPSQFCEIARNCTQNPPNFFEQVFQLMPIFKKSFILSTGDLRILDFCERIGRDPSSHPTFELPDRDWSLARLRESSASVLQSPSPSILGKMLLTAEVIPEDTTDERITLTFLSNNLVEPLPSYEKLRGNLRLALLAKEFPDGVPMPFDEQLELTAPEKVQRFAASREELKRNSQNLTDHWDIQSSIARLALLSMCLVEKEVDISPDRKVIERLANISEAWTAFSKNTRWNRGPEDRVPILRLWQEIPYRTFMSCDPKLAEMDRDFAAVWDKIQFHHDDDSNPVRDRVMQDFEHKRPEIIQWMKAIFQCADVLVAAALFERIYKAFSIAFTEEKASEFAVDDYLSLFVFAFQFVKPTNWISRYYWLNTIALPMKEKTNDKFIRASFPQRFVPMGHILSLFLEQKPALLRYTMIYPGLKME